MPGPDDTYVFVNATHFASMRSLALISPDEESLNVPCEYSDELGMAMPLQVARRSGKSDSPVLAETFVRQLLPGRGCAADSPALATSLSLRTPHRPISHGLPSTPALSSKTSWLH